MKLYVCYGRFGGDKHACTRAQNAVEAAGHSPEIVKSYGAGMLPDTPFNMTAGRKRAKELTGKSMVPVLELDDGSAIGGSQKIVDWAAANPAAVSV